MTQAPNMRINQILQSYEKLDDAEIVVGYQGVQGRTLAQFKDHKGKIHTSTITLAALAAIHNFGTKRAGRNRSVEIKARPFMSLGFMAVLPEVRKRMDKIAVVANRGGAPKSLLDTVGAAVVRAMLAAHKSLKGSARYALAESTIEKRKKRRGAKKGDNATPLFDTGGLRAGLSFDVRRAGSTRVS